MPGVKFWYRKPDLTEPDLSVLNKSIVPRENSDVVLCVFTRSSLEQSGLCLHSASDTSTRLLSLVSRGLHFTVQYWYCVCIYSKEDDESGLQLTLTDIFHLDRHR